MQKVLDWIGNSSYFASKKLIVVPSSNIRKIILNQIIENSLLPEIVTYKEMHTLLFKKGEIKKRNHELDLDFSIMENLLSYGVSASNFSYMKQKIFSGENLDEKSNTIKQSILAQYPELFCETSYIENSINILSKYYPDILIMLNDEVSNASFNKDIEVLRTNYKNAPLPEYSRDLKHSSSSLLNNIEVINFDNKYDLVNYHRHKFSDIHTVCFSKDVKELMQHQKQVMDIGLVQQSETIISLLKNVWQLAFNKNNESILSKIIQNEHSVFYNYFQDKSFVIGDVGLLQYIISKPKLKTIYDMIEGIQITSLNEFTTLFKAILNDDEYGSTVKYKSLQALHELSYAFSKKNLVCDEGCLDFIISTIKERVFFAGNPPNLLALPDIGFINLKEVVLIEPGIEAQEKEIIKDPASFKVFSNRLRYILGAEKVTIMKSSDMGEQSIFMELLRSKTIKQNIKNDALFDDKEYTALQAPPSVLVDIDKIPTKYYVSDISKLMENPYIFSYEKIMGIKKYDKLWHNIEAKKFGIFVHEIASKIDFSCKGFDFALEEQINSFIEHFSEMEFNVFKSRVTKILNYFRDFHDKYLNNYKLLKEQNGSYSLNINNEDISIAARADLIAINNDEIIVADYKTGNLPTKKEVLCGVAPQIPLEMLIAKKQGFDDIHINNINGFFVSSNGIDDKNKIDKVATDLEMLEEDIKKLLDLFIKKEAVFFSRVGGKLKYYRDYDHLIRFEEWFENYIKI